MTLAEWREARRLLVLALLGFLAIAAVLVTATVKALRG